MTTIYFTVTNDLNYDQRMIRICSSLTNAGYNVTLVGRKLKDSKPLVEKAFKQKRLPCIFTKGKLFYAEYSIRLFFYLLLKKMNCICAIDLDTILPCLFISKIKKITRVYDAHELFCEMQEIVERPSIYKVWKRIEKYAVPKYTNGYTVNEPIADEFKKMYGVDYKIVRSISNLKPLIQSVIGNYFLYQGAVNEGRSFETLLPAIKESKLPLWICGDGNFMLQTKALVQQYQLEDKVIFKGKILPNELWQITQQAYAGITLFDKAGKSNYYSLANRFFDYMHAGIPQLCVNYPVYESINDEHHFALMIEDVETKTIEDGLNKLVNDAALYTTLKENALKAREELNWQQEEKILIAFYKTILA